MTEKKNRNKYWTDYRKMNYKTYMLKIRNDKKDVIKKLEKVKSKNGYIIELIEKDIKKEE